MKIGMHLELYGVVDDYDDSGDINLFNQWTISSVSFRSNPFNKQLSHMFILTNEIVDSNSDGSSNISSWSIGISSGSVLLKLFHSHYDASIWIVHQLITLPVIVKIRKENLIKICEPVKFTSLW